MAKRSDAEQRSLTALDGAQPLYEHARWVFERDEQRSADFVSRAVGLMSVAAALAALVPVGYALVEGRLEDIARVVVQSVYVGSEVVLALSVILGLIVVAPGQSSVPPRAQLLRRWDTWQTATAIGDPPSPAASLYRDFAGAILDAAEGREHSPLHAQRRLTDRRVLWFGRMAVSFIVALLLVAVGSITVLVGA
jgi:hypothetical protein